MASPEGVADDAGVQGPVFAPPARTPQQPNDDRPLVVLLIGMRGAGKTTVGRNAAEVLGFEFADLDEVISNGQQKPIPEIVKDAGMPHFRTLECNALEQAIAGQHTAGQPGIVACGGGIIETERGMSLLEAHWPVVFVDRHLNDILECLAAPAAGHRFSLGEHPADTYRRRLPRYLQCLNYRLPVQRGEVDKLYTSRGLSRLVRFFTGRGREVYIGPDTFFVSLTLPDLAAENSAIALQDLQQVARGADILEFRVDLLASLQHEEIAQQMAILRRHAAGAPILFTVRSRDHGGAFDGSEEDYVALNLFGLSLGCELLDVECTWSEAAIKRIVAQRGRTLLLGSFHDFNRMPEMAELGVLFQRCKLDGAAAVAKVVVKPQTYEDSWSVQKAGSASGGDFIGLCLGDEGRLSRVLNRVLCPATHPRLSAAAPGQLSVNEVVACRRTLCLLSPVRQFLVLAPQGFKECDTALDLLPKALNAAIRELKLPHICRLVRVDTDAEVAHLLSLTSVGGAMLFSHLRADLFSLIEAEPPEEGGTQQSQSTRSTPALTSVANAAGAVSLVTKHQANSAGDGKCDSLEVLMFQDRLKALSLDFTDGIGLVLQGTDAGGARGAGTATEGIAAQLALAELGMGRVVVHGGEESQCVLSSGNVTFSIKLDRTKGAKLGLDVLDSSDRHGLRVVAVKGELTEDWNMANPDLHVRKDDTIVEVNGASGDAAALVQECKQLQVLNIKVSRKLTSLKAPRSWHEKVKDLSLLAGLQRLDVVILAGQIDATAEAELRIAIERLKPAVIVAQPSTSSLQLGLVEQAKAAGCKVIGVGEQELLQEQACLCLAAWTGTPMSSAREVLEKFIPECNGRM